MPSPEKNLVFAVFISAMVLFILVALVVLLVYNYFKVRSRRDREILKAVFETQEQERNRIATDLHDDVGGKLSALKLYNEHLLAEFPDGPVREHADKAGTMIDTVVHDIRKIVRNQASRYIIEQGLALELTRMCRQFEQTAKIRIVLETPFQQHTLSPDFSVALFRMTQELLHNTVKHAAASVVTIFIGPEGNSFLLKYTDDGIGFNYTPAASGGMGLQNITTRARLYAATIQFTCEPNRETGFSFRFPSGGIHTKG